MKKDKLQPAAKRYDDDDHMVRYWVETDAACGCYYGGESSLPTSDHQMAKRLLWFRYGAKILAALRRVKPDGY